MAIMEMEKNSKYAKVKNRHIRQAKWDKDQLHSLELVTALQLVCGSTVVVGLWVVPGYMGINLTDQPVQTLQIVVALALPVMLIVFSVLRMHTKTVRISAWWAMLRGLLSLPVGVLVAIIIAFVLGAPIPHEDAKKTFHWAALMSMLAVVPGATVLGASKPRWFRIFLSTLPVGPVEFAICIPAHGAALGAWFGAWPMPLDWERPWQEWPICCTYGAVCGYLVSLVGSLMWSYMSFQPVHKKQD